MKNLSDHPDYPKILDEERDKLDKELATTTEGKDLLDEGEDWGGLPSDPIPHPTPDWEKKFDKRFLATNYDDVIGIDNPASIIKSFIRQAISEAEITLRDSIRINVDSMEKKMAHFINYKGGIEQKKYDEGWNGAIKAVQALIHTLTNPQPK